MGLKLFKRKKKVKETVPSEGNGPVTSALPAREEEAVNGTKNGGATGSTSASGAKRHSLLHQFSHISLKASQEEKQMPTRTDQPTTLSDSYGRRRNFSSASSAPSHRTNSSTLHGIVQKNTPVPDELIPIVTLIHAQASRVYFETVISVPVSATDTFIQPNMPIEWYPATIRLSGTDLAVLTQSADEPLMINIADAEISSADADITIQITDRSSYTLRCQSQDELHYILGGMLLAQFENKQLQEGFTGALLSSKAIHFSDVRTVLDPNNTHTVSEWCIMRFPFLNDKWIRCFVVVIPDAGSKTDVTGKIEVYTSSTTSRKNLLATVIKARTCYSIYPESPEYIDDNALVRVCADCFVNESLLNEVINESSTKDVARARSHSLTKRLSSSSLKRRSSSQKRLGHSRTSSTVSNASSNGDKRLSKLKNFELLQTALCYLIPETHGSVEPCETMIRILIPIMNTFHLYGRPEKFVASREQRNSLLFGFPQLPHTQYLDMQSANDLVVLNLENAQREQWNSYEWSEVFKELVYVKISKGWNGSGSLVDTYKDSLVYDRNLISPETYDYDPTEDFEFRRSASTIADSPVSPVFQNGSRDFSKESTLNEGSKIAQ